MASAIGLTADARSAEALVSKDKGSSRASSSSSGSVKGSHTSRSQFFSTSSYLTGCSALSTGITPQPCTSATSTALGLYPSKVRFMVCIGQAFCEHWPELLCGVGDEPGIRSANSRHATAPSFPSTYPCAASAAHGTPCGSSRPTPSPCCRDRIHANDLPKQENAAVEGTGTTAASACTPEGQPNATAGSTDTTPVNAEAPAEGTPPQARLPRTFADEHPTYIQAMAGFNEHQIAATRIVQRGGRPYLAVADRPEYLEGLEGRIESRRHAVNETQRERIGHVAFEPQYALSINDALFKLDNVHDIEDRIRIGLAGVADDRRTIAVLVARLESEEVFRYLWKDFYRSFARYARLCLGIDEELKDLLSVGRNILKYPVFFYGAEALDTDVAFSSLRYLGDAMNTHHSKVELIRARIKTLTCREFAEFATDASFEDRHASKSISFRQEEVLNGFFAQIAHYQGIGQSVKIVEVLADYEIPHVERFIREAQSAYEMAQDVTTEVTNTTDAEAQALPIDALSHEEEKMLIAFPNIDGRKNGAIAVPDAKVISFDDFRSGSTAAQQEAAPEKSDDSEAQGCLIPPREPMPSDTTRSEGIGPLYQP